MPLASRTVDGQLEVEHTFQAMFLGLEAGLGRVLSISGMAGYGWMLVKEPICGQYIGYQQSCRGHRSIPSGRVPSLRKGIPARIPIRTSKGDGCHQWRWVGCNSQLDKSRVGTYESLLVYP